MLEFIKVQMDRQLAGRYSSDDKKKGAVKQLVGELGSKISSSEEKPFIGAIVQEKIHGVNFKEAIEHVDRNSPSFDRLRTETRSLIAALRSYHNENDYTAFTWHGLTSDNVMVETTATGEITGRVVIIDANFTERPNKSFKDAVIKKIESDVFEKLEQALDL